MINSPKLQWISYCSIDLFYFRNIAHFVVKHVVHSKHGSCIYLLMIPTKENHCFLRSLTRSLGIVPTILGCLETFMCIYDLVIKLTISQRQKGRHKYHYISRNGRWLRFATVHYIDNLPLPDYVLFSILDNLEIVFTLWFALHIYQDIGLYLDKHKLHSVYWLWSSLVDWDMFLIYTSYILFMNIIHTDREAVLWLEHNVKETSLHPNITAECNYSSVLFVNFYGWELDLLP